MSSEDTQLIEAFFKISRCLKENMRFEKDFVHLTMLQVQTLIFIKKNKGAQMTEIAKQFKIELPSATSLINNLSKLNLVTRKDDNKDRRLVRISVTQKGVDLLQRAMMEQTKKMQESLSYLSQPEKKALLKVIEKLATQMEKFYEK